MATITHLNPAALTRSPAFSQGVSVEGPARTIYVGGQNAVTADGAIVGTDIATQTAQALHNVELVLAEAGAQLQDVVSWRMAVVAGHDLGAAAAAFAEVWGRRGEPPAISVDIVGLANPGFLVEITAVAVVATQG